MLVPVLCVLLFELLTTDAASARRGITGTVEGRVRDRQRNEFLQSVNVTILGLSRGTVTDSAGFYQIGNIRAGEYDVRFSMIGYNTVVMKNVTILPDLKTRLNVALEAASVEMPAVEIRAVRPLIQIDQAMSAFNVEEAKLDKLPITKFEDVVGLQPGVTLEGNIRGGRTSDAIYLVDGLPVQDVISGGIGTSLPKSSISGVTVMTGGLDAEYGNATSGVINVVTKGGGNTQSITARIDRDNWIPDRYDQQVDKSLEAEVTASGPVVTDNLYYFTSNILASSDTRWWQDFQHFFSSPIRKEFSGLSKVEYLFTPTLRLGLQGIYSFQDWRDYEYSWRFNLGGLPPEVRNSYRLALTLSHTFSDKGFYTLSLSTYSLRSKIGSGSKADLSLLPYEYDFYLQYVLNGTRNWWEDTRQNITTFKGDVTWQPNRFHVLKAGVTLNQYDINSDLVKYEPETTYFGKPIPDAPMLNYSNSYHYLPRSGSAYVQDKFQIVEEGTNVNFGLRWDFFDPTAERPVVEFIPVTQNQYGDTVTGNVRTSLKQQVSPRLSLAFPVNPTSFFFFNFGKYFQFPLFDYLYSGLNPVQLKLGAKNVQAGNVDLQPEQLTLWEAGFKQTIRADLVFSATYFVKQMKNQIDARTLIPFDSKYGGDYGFASYVNNSQADATGLELVLTREREEPVAGSISYTYMETEGYSEYVDQNINIAMWGFPLAPIAYPLSWDQTHTLKADLDFKVPGGIQTNLLVLYNSPRPYTYYPTRDGYTPVDTSKVFLPNNRRMSYYLGINVKLSKSFTLSETTPVSLTLYADIRNLLNRKNVKWMDSEGRVGGEL
ncbi:MAG TPA: TonB-dependent receptor, partial [Bacteroidota bacterium]|nr:TonB-dependent receptor [Bacteroidota bacterium]